MVDSFDQRLHRKRCGNDCVDGADPGAGQHGGDRLGKPAEVQGDSAAGAQAHRSKGTGEVDDILVQFGESESPSVTGFALPKDRSIVGLVAKMAIDTIHRNIEQTIDKPVVEGWIGLPQCRPRSRPLGFVRCPFPRAERLIGFSMVSISHDRASCPPHWPHGSNG